MKQVMKIVIFLLFTCSAKAASFYWVGGNGNWTDFQNHWAMASGGTVFHTSVPTASDDVFFDANSFPTANDTLVKINTSVAYARQLTFTTAQHLVYLSFNTNAALQVYGSATFADEVKVLKGNFYFKSTSTSNQLTFNKSKEWTNTSITFDGIGGNWTLVDSLTTAGNVYLRNGSLDLSGKVIRCESFESNYTSNRALKFENAKLYIYQMLLNATNLITTHQYSCIRTTQIRNYGSVKFPVDTMIIKDRVTLESVAANVFYGNNSTNSFAKSIVNTIYLDGGRVSASGLVITDGYWNAITQLSIGSFEILGTLSITGNDCSHRLAVSGGTIKKSSGTFTFHHASLQNLNATGGASFAAVNCDDLGNNTGISFSNPAPVTYYWIGNGGSALDVEHWSQASGGAPAACLPLSSDNFVIDELSFDGNGLTTLDNIAGHNLNASAVDVPIQLRYPMLSGSIYLSSLCTYTVLQLKSAQLDNEVDMNGATGSTVVFSGTGSWSLLDSLHCSELNFDGGRVNANGYKIKATNFTLNNGTGDFSNCLIETYKVSGPFSPGPSNFDHATILFKKGGEMGLRENVFQVIVESGQWAARGNVQILNVNGIITYDGEADSVFVQQGTGFTINGSLEVEDVQVIPHSDLCGTLTHFKAGDQGIAHIIKESGTLNLDHVSLFMISAEGGAEFNAFQSVDLGSNDGWHFTLLPATTFYWINDSGDWEDPQHWSLSSGGSSGDCIPGIQDKVVFDNNSFSGPGHLVVKEDGIIQVSGFTAYDIPENTGFTNSEFILFGDGMFSAHMEGPDFHVVLKGNRPIHLTTNGFQFNLRSMADSVKLMDDCNFLSSNNSFSLERGFLDISNRNIAVYSFQCAAISDSISLDMSGTLLKSMNANFEIRPWNIHTDQSRIKLLFNNNRGVYFRTTAEVSGYYDPFISRIHFPYIECIPFGRLTDDLSMPLVVDLAFTDIDELYIAGLDNNGVSLTMNSSSIQQLLDYSLTYLNMINGKECLVENAKIANNIFLGSGNTYFNYLKLMPGISVMVSDEDTLFIGEFMDAIGSSALPISISSFVNGNSAYIHSNGEDLCFAYLAVSNLTACGNATFYAGPSSTDIFNNSGWDFTSNCQSLTIEDNLPLCNDDALVLTPIHPSNITGFLWTHPDGSQSNTEVLTKDPVHEDDLGLYQLSAGGMTRKTMVHQSVEPDTVIYTKDGYIEFATPIDIDTVTWYYNDAYSSFYNGPMIYPSSTGDYYALFSTSSGCQYRTNTVTFNGIVADPLYKPYQLTAVSQDAGISLTWKDINSGLTGFELYVSTQENSGYAKIATLNAFVFSYLDNRNLPPGTYYYKVRAVKSGTYSDYSNLATVVVTVLSSQQFSDTFQALTVYPVPMQEVLHVESHGVRIRRLAIYNQQGMLLLEQEVNDDNGQVITKELNQGVYLLQIIADDTTAYKTIIK